MRKMIGVAVLAVSASCSKPAAVQSDLTASDTLPQRGNYHVVHEVVQGNESKTDEFDTEMGGFDRQMLESEIAKDAGSKCDKKVSIDDGSFNVRMTCSAPDGDFNNMDVEREGTFSKNSLEVTTRSTLMGASYRESFRAHLNAG